MAEQSLKVDSTKYPQLREEDLDIQIAENGKDVVVMHKQWSINVDCDTKQSLQENWNMAQESLAQAIEFQEHAQADQKPIEGHL